MKTTVYHGTHTPQGPFVWKASHNGRRLQALEPVTETFPWDADQGPGATA
ncbi:hypothetical protein [Sulfobacillus thermosulfidooxidans]|nr:hypothetical protein [Sulfobacillus thermosulfidooxidans]